MWICRFWIRIASGRHSQPNRHLTCREECLKASGRQSVMPGTASIASLSVNLTATSQSSSPRSDDGDTRGPLKASFARVTATTKASIRFYLTLSERNVVWMPPSTMRPTYRHTGGEPLTFSSAYLTTPSSPCQNTWTPSATFYIYIYHGIRSWFGLVHQVSNYAQLRDIVAPFTQFINPRYRIELTP